MTTPTVPFPDTGLAPGAHTIPLCGFSGCPVTLVDDAHGLYVRKIARDADYNPRLMRQATKQKSFQHHDIFHAVKIRATGTLASGLFYIDMDYVTGGTAAETIATLPLSDILHWTGLLLRFSDMPSTGNLAPGIFHAKIAELRRDLTERDYLTPTITEALHRLQRRAWTGIPQSPCHGDLTLENIIVHDGQLYLIDFLDAFADSWYLDIAKLWQDLLGGWSFRRRAADRNLILRLASLRHSLQSLIEARCPGCMPAILDLYALSLLRILPYCSSPEDRAFIDSRLTTALQDFL